MIRNGLKWFCALSAASLDSADHDFRSLVTVAVGSALRNTRLRPHLIYDGPPDSFTAHIAEMGVLVMHHRSLLYDALSEAANGSERWLHTAAGAYLRFEIPALELHDNLVLYTDCDVMFLRDPVFGSEAPSTFGASSEFAQAAPFDLNSGVMLINVAAMREVLPALYRFTRARLLNEQVLDQAMLDEFFGRNYLFLDRTLNWKPYWGWNPNAQIVHFHGPKPVAVKHHLTGGQVHENAGWAELLTWDRAGYEAYTRLWYLYRDVLIPQFTQADGAR